MCGIQCIENSIKEVSVFDADYSNYIVKSVFDGGINLRRLNEDLYLKTSHELINSVYDGFGEPIENTSYGSKEYNMLFDLKRNVYYFSAAKQYQFIRDVLDNKADTNFTDFENKAKETFNKYYSYYLAAELFSATRQALTAKEWINYPSGSYLTYVTAGDGRVRPEHAMLNNISRPVTDRFWNNYTPPNGWNCRCTLVNSPEGIKTDLTDFTKPSTVPPEFMFNAGKDRVIFSPKHPYFKVAIKDLSFAKNNFGMPTP